MTSQEIRVAAVQMDCQAGQVAANREHATRLVECAEQQGAQWVLLPELAPCGYQLTEQLWDSAERADGATVQWLTGLAARLDIYLGTTFLEADGEDFYNTFVLATPHGEIAGRVRKTPPATLEAYFYRSGGGAHVIATAWGRVGVGICYENLLYDRLLDLYRTGVDLMLQPLAAGRPGSFIPKDGERFDRTIRRGALYYAKTLGVPVVMADRCGPFRTELPGGTGVLDSSFPGLSMIVDADGTVKAALGVEEGVIVADIHPGSGAKAPRQPRPYGRRWAFRVPWYAFIWPMTQKPAERAYAANRRRREKARSISRG